MDLFNILVDDWKKIPQNLRYFFIAGAFLIFNSWLLDHWGSGRLYLFWGFDIRNIGYNLGLSLILLCFLFLLTKQVLYFKNIIIYRRRYPIKELNIKFHLVWFNGRLILFDKSTKKHHHIYPIETAQDLLFAGTGTYIPKNFGDDKLVQVTENLTIDISKYSDGGAINTRG